jgi:RNA polymerase sigma-70 factor (ECF subfamily)
MSTENIHNAVSQLYRQTSGSITAALANRYGAHVIPQIEDAVQEAMLKAMSVWAYRGIPEKPESWLLVVASNHLKDQFKKENRLNTSSTIPIQHVVKEVDFDELQDEQLKMIFACCHPELSDKESFLLSLKLIGGFSIVEISRALLMNYEATKKSYQRAKKKFVEKVGHIHIPPAKFIEPYMDRVLRVIYLIFNEGYSASEGEYLIKEDLCGEALRLAKLVADFQIDTKKRPLALLSLMNFKSARFGTRLGSDGELVLFEDQNRASWSQEFIYLGYQYFEQSEVNSNPSDYHLEAAVEYEYNIAQSHKQINWERIKTYYQAIFRMKPIEQVAVSYLFASYKCGGFELFNAELQHLSFDFNENRHFHALSGDIFSRIDKSRALSHFKKAKDLSRNKLETKYFEQRISKLN